MAVVAAALSMWVIAGLWHNLVLPSLYADREAHHDGLGLMLVAYFVLAGLMTYLYRRASDGSRPARDGAGSRSALDDLQAKGAREEDMAVPVGASRRRAVVIAAAPARRSYR
jgi:hypothetical protein